MLDVPNQPISTAEKDATDKLHFLGLCQAQWLVIEREFVKFMGFVLVTVGALNPDAALHLTQGLEMTFGGLLILRPIVYQVWKNSITQRIKEVAELPNVKGVVADPQTANVTLATDLKVVSNPDQLKGVTV